MIMLCLQNWEESEFTPLPGQLGKSSWIIMTMTALRGMHCDGGCSTMMGYNGSSPQQGKHNNGCITNKGSAIMVVAPTREALQWL